MDMNQIREKARADMGGMCHACPVCDGRACGTRIPGPGSRGGDAYRNYQAWQQWQLLSMLVAIWRLLSAK